MTATATDSVLKAILRANTSRVVTSVDDLTEKERCSIATFLCKEKARLPPYLEKLGPVIFEFADSVLAAGYAAQGLPYGATEPIVLTKAEQYDVVRRVAPNIIDGWIHWMAVHVRNRYLPVYKNTGYPCTYMQAVRALRRAACPFGELGNMLEAVGDA